MPGEPMRPIRVDERVHRRHPDVTDDDVRYAWSHIVRSMRRDGKAEPTQYLAVGVAPDGCWLEMLAIIDAGRGTWHIYRAMAVQRKALRELGLI